MGLLWQSLNVFIIMKQPFHYGTADCGLRWQSSLLLSLFNYGTAGRFAQVTFLCEGYSVIIIIAPIYRQD